MSGLPWDKRGALGNLESIFAGGFKAHSDTELQTESPEFAFAKALEDFGLDVDGGVIADGKIHRCRTQGDRKRRKTGWYVLYLDNVPAGAYGDYRVSDEPTTWCAKSAHELTDQELAENRRRMDEARRQRAAELARRHQAAATVAQELVSAAVSADPAHPYLSAKGVPADGLLQVDADAARTAWRAIKRDLGEEGDRLPPSLQRADGPLLLAPLDKDGAVSTVQLITAGGDKLLLPGGEKRGACLVLGRPGRTIYVAEGLATAATVREATGEACAVAIDRTNLGAVAQHLRAAHPSARIVIAADNDQFTEGNPGLRNAEEAAGMVGGSVVCPAFTDLTSRPTDFNDLAALQGLEAVREQLGVGKPPSYRVDLGQWCADRYAGAVPDRQWLVRDVLPLGVPVMVASMGGAGKSLKMLDLAFKVAIHDDSAIVPLFAFGKPVATGGTAVMFCAEDDAAEIHRRLNNLDPQGMRFARPDRLRVIPLPDIGGPMPLVTMAGGEPAVTKDFFDLRDQLASIEDLKLVVFDPLQALVAADVNADPAVGQFFCTVLARLASETGCTVVATHHMRKPSKPITSPQEARDAIRGTTALVDGMRATYAIWQEDDAERIARARSAAGYEDRVDVFAGAVVKANFPVDKDTRTYVRNPDSGLLTDVTTQLFTEAPKEKDLLEQLFDAIKSAAESGHPYTKSNGAASGLWMRRYELPPDLAATTRAHLYSLVDRLLADERLVMAKGSTGTDAKWLDVPGGRFAIGLGDIKPGAYRRKGK